MVKKFVLASMGIIAVLAFVRFFSKADRDLKTTNDAVPSSIKDVKANENHHSESTTGQASSSLEALSPNEKSSKKPANQPTVYAAQVTPEQVLADAEREKLKSSTKSEVIDDRVLTEMLADELKDDRRIQAIMEVNSVDCKGGTCTMEFEAKSDELSMGLQTAVINFLGEHAKQYGMYSMVYAEKETPRLAKFTVTKERPANFPKP